MSKKNTRKKKNNNANIYNDMDVFAGAVDEDAEEDEVHAKKGGKTNKGGGKHEGKKEKKKKAKVHSESDEEEKKEEPEPVAKSEESEPEEVEEADFPINMVYCGCKYNPISL